MKRFHVHLNVEDLDTSIRFYSSLFAAAPRVQCSDYAKWRLDDPRVNFAISQRAYASGVNHLGFQTESAAELQAMRAQLEAVDASLVEQTGRRCCYTRSDKYWVTDPAGVAWETFHTFGSIPAFGEDTPAVADSACCVPIQSIGAAARHACCAPVGTDRSNTASSSCCPG